MIPLELLIILRNKLPDKIITISYIYTL